MSKLAILLTVAFVVLKLCGVIAWSWLACFAPVLIFSVIVLVLIILPFVPFIGLILRRKA